jgi:hypothetical protein
MSKTIKKNNLIWFSGMLIVAVALCSCNRNAEKSITDQQKEIRRFSMMADMPEPYNVIDWHQKALDFDSIVYDFNAEGEYWPLIWLDDNRKNLDQTTFGLYTAIGDVRQGNNNNNGMFHESINSLGSILGATLVGIDKSDQDGYNFVLMAQNYFNTENGWNIIMNNTCPEVAALGGGYARDWWYDVFPNLLFYGVANFYPQVGITEEIQKSIAEQFYKADSVLNGNYDFSFFNYAEMQGEKNIITSQQDAAAGHAYVLYCAWKKFGDERYLEGAKSALSSMEKLRKNRFYEVLMPFGAYVAARLNAEHNTDYDVSRWINWTCNGAAGRKGWGILAGNWNGYDISGLQGSIVHNKGYAFLMNTFDMAWALVPIVRYDPSYANAIGKWMLNAANAARLFYPYEIPDDHQTIPEKKEVTKGVIAYEGLIYQSTFKEYSHLQAPVAQGDGPNWVKDENPDVSQFSVYSSSHVGIFGSIIEETNVKGILRLDLLATDFYRTEAYPTYLYYNPYDEEKELVIGDHISSVYDIISNEFIEITNGEIRISPNSSYVLVYIPENAEKEIIDGRLYLDEVIVDYNYHF